MKDRHSYPSAGTSAAGFAILAWLSTTLVMLAVVARLSWTAGGLFAGAALVALGCALLLSRTSS